MEATAVQDATEDLVNVDGLLMVHRDNSVEFIDRMDRFDRSLTVLGVFREVALRIQVDSDSTSKLESMCLVKSQVVTHTTLFAVEIGSTKVFLTDHFTSSCLHKRWPSQENRSSLLHHNDFVGHGRHISPTSSAATKHNSDLRNSLARHTSLVEKDTTEVVTVREHIILLGQEGPRRIYQVDAWKVVLLGDLLRTEMLLDRDREVSTTLIRA